MGGQERRWGDARYADHAYLAPVREGLAYHWGHVHAGVRSSAEVESRRGRGCAYGGLGFRGALAQLVGALPCHGRGCGFDPGASLVSGETIGTEQPHLHTRLAASKRFRDEQAGNRGERDTEHGVTTSRGKI